MSLLTWKSSKTESAIVVATVALAAIAAELITPISLTVNPPTLKPLSFLFGLL